MDEKKAAEALKAWLETDFSNEKRHARRLEKIRQYENSKSK